ncbi:FAD-dependent oxidoreductase [Williamsia muralis]|uniref:NAD(P)/FAD-dependent oxidoreductase n=1 Tax=Williamsia marianensis TaxID=85044 RepID=A0ABU4EYS4_WILMA|nr:NAD(P)/FAD-dependent oxidoreductase [Williamsia muralis]MDV7136404.1 NAD(P)/FAD-dependent oxidoreductase [Williamsia muralis]
MDADVVVIGGGIGGCALATRLAKAGVAVTVLEREATYRDMVRGEAMVPWGFTEARELGVADAVLQADGVSVVTRMVPYDESSTIDQALSRASDLSAVVPGAPGVIGVGHPELRAALANAAAEAGAAVVHGVRRTTVVAGDDPQVTFDRDGAQRTISCRFIVGADGKFSVTRGALGIPMFASEPRVRLTGMLVDDGGLWDRDVTTIAVDGRNQFIVIPRADNKLRLYVGRRVNDPNPLRGPATLTEFLESYRTPIFPDHDQLAESTPIGPCATFPMNDAWTDTPVVPGGALIGDAAGWSNPVTAQGLSITLRDARVLSEALLDNVAWNPTTLSEYTVERNARMARLRFASALTDLIAGFGMTDRMTRRPRIMRMLGQRPELGAALAAVHSGPWSVEADSYSPDILTTLALA